MSREPFAPEYVDVATRLAEFREKHPDGSLQPADLARPYGHLTIGTDDFVVVVAAAYRSPDDPRPGIGMAYEPYPGRTNFTRGSELQNAETSAWGRAIVAALAADTKRGVASADEVRNRQADREAAPDPRTSLFGSVKAVGRALKLTDEQIADDFVAWSLDTEIQNATVDQLTLYIASLKERGNG